MKSGLISKLLMVLTVFLVSVMAVSAFTVDATVVAPGDSHQSDTTLSCRYILSGNLGTYDSVTIKWFKNNAEQPNFADQKTNKIDGTDSSEGPKGIEEIDPYDQWYCKVTAVAGVDTKDDQAATFSIKNYAPTLDQWGTFDIAEDSSTLSYPLMSFANDKDLTQSEKTAGLTFSITYEDASKVDCSITADGTLSYTPAINFNGDAKCIIKVTDAYNSQKTADVNFKVAEIPDLFTITPIADHVAKIGQLFNYEVTVSNPDKCIVGFSLSEQPGTMSIAKISDQKAKISFTPLSKDLGVFSGINVIATACGSAYNEDFKLTVYEKTAPTMGTISDQKVTADGKWTLNLGSLVSNVDSVPVVFSLEAKAPTTLIPAQMTMSTDGTVYTNNKLEWTPSVANIGTYYFTVKAKYKLSGLETTMSRDFKLRVGKESCLIITDIDASVGASEDEMDSDSGVNKDGGSVDVKPGDKLNINVELKNICEEEDDKDFKHTVEDIEVTVTLDEIGGEDEQDKDKDYKPIDSNDKDNQDYPFTIPQDAEKGTYKLTITGDGSDEDTGDFYEIDPVTVDVIVDKEEHDLSFNTFTLNPTTLSCTKNTQLTVKLVNLGNNDEDDIELVAASDELNFEEIELIDELQEGDSDDKDSYFKKTYSINVPSSVKTGTYVITAKAYYDNDDEVETASAVLTVVPCGPSSTDSNEEEDEEVVEEGQDGVVEVITTAAPITSSTQTATATPVTNDDVITQDSFFESDLYVGLLIAAIVVVLLVIIGLVVAISRR